ncbi:hypothetical protein [Jhaorihella thermophila]|uniref:hypothetical protein n=1 Tax=Jhaorihella thermophila TaxID=488547 RepID=UPI0011B0D58D|nr:hypothetical protein [Jhaorihella thermophila]
MPRDFTTEFATFSLDMHHIYKMNGEEWRFAYKSNGQAIFSLIDDPATKVTYELGTLNRMNAAGLIDLKPFGLMPEHLRPAPVEDYDDVFLSDCHRLNATVSTLGTQWCAASWSSTKRRRSKVRTSRSHWQWRTLSTTPLPI